MLCCCSSKEEQAAMENFIEELKRRSVFRVGIAYLVVAWLVLQLTDLVFENMNAPDWVMQVIMLVIAVGFPIALVLAWAFELKADGVQRDSEDTPGSASNSRLFYAFVGIISVAAIGFFLWQQYRPALQPTDSPTQTESSGASAPENESLLAIAVLPFESFTEDREDQYFADGLADTLLHKLSQLETLTVIARNSSFQYKGQNVDVRDVGENLGVPTVVEGSVQRQGDQIRVIAQLVSTEDGAHWWSGTFDGTYENIFDLQDEIAAAIA
jgi:TolB-like protein